MKLYLASASPRRRAILKELLVPYDMPFSIVDFSFQEKESGYPPEKLVMINARGKITNLSDTPEHGSVIIGADTLVWLDDENFGKPSDNKEAEKFLKQLSNRSHSVLTGVAVLNIAANRIFDGYEKTVVTFKKLSDEEIKQYVSSLEPLDKAGAYGIQGLGAELIKKIEGSYSNVVGLPKGLTRELLKLAISC